MLSTYLGNAPRIKYGLGPRLWHRARHALRPPLRYGSAEEQALDRDGIAVIQNFLPERDFEDLLSEYGAVRQSLNVPRRREFVKDGLHVWATVFTRHDKALSVANTLLRDHTRIRELVEHICRRTIDRWPDTMSIMDQRLAGTDPATDSNTRLHRDVHYATSKVVLYLTDVGPGDGPFLYVYGSHRFAWRDEPPATAQATPVYAPKNTLIIANHHGYHARGPLAPGRNRVTLRISFRYLESPRYRFRKLIEPLRRPPTPST